MIDLQYGELNAVEASRIQEHLNSCPSCMKEYQELESTLDCYRKAEFNGPSDQCLQNILSAANRQVRENSVTQMTVRYKAAAAVFLVGFTGLLLYVCTVDFSANREKGTDSKNVAMLKESDKLKQREEKDMPALNKDLSDAVTQDKETKEPLVPSSGKANKGVKSSKTIESAETNGQPRARTHTKLRTPLKRLKMDSNSTGVRKKASKDGRADTVPGRALTAADTSPQKKKATKTTAFNEKSKAEKRLSEHIRKPSGTTGGKNKKDEIVAVLSEYEESSEPDIAKAKGGVGSVKKKSFAEERGYTEKNFKARAASRTETDMDKPVLAMRTEKKEPGHRESFKKHEAADKKRDGFKRSESERRTIEFGKAFANAMNLYHARKYKAAISLLLDIKKRPGFSDLNKNYDLHYLTLLGKCYKHAGMKEKKSAIEKEINKKHFAGKIPDYIERDLRSERKMKQKLMKEQDTMDAETLQ